MKLIIGAEHRQKEGWTHHDVQDLPGIDVVCDFWDLPEKVEAGSCSHIEMTHVLEHFPMNETAAVIHVLHTLLQPGGELYIEVPNFYWHAQQIMQDPSDRQIVEYAFGGQRNKWDFHFNGFTPHTLKEDLEEGGFTIKELVPASSIECRAVRK